MSLCRDLSQTIAQADFTVYHSYVAVLFHAVGFEAITNTGQTDILSRCHNLTHNSGSSILWAVESQCRTRLVLRKNVLLCLWRFQIYSDRQQHQNLLFLTTLLIWHPFFLQRTSTNIYINLILRVPGLHFLCKHCSSVFKFMLLASKSAYNAANKIAICNAEYAQLTYTDAVPAQ